MVADVELSPTDIAALRFLKTNGTDTIGLIDSEEKMAAALYFVGLKDRGLVIAEITNDGPRYRLTRKGEAALSEVSND